MKIEAEVSGVISEPNSASSLQPIIVNFLNGQLKNDETNNMKSSVFFDQKCGKTVLALSNGKIVYKGYRPNLDEEAMCTMLVVHNKKTGKIKLVQAERWDVAPVLDRNLNIDKDLKVDKIATLNKQFGSKKVKRRTEIHEKMKISGESVKEILEKTVSNVEIEKIDGSDTEESLSNNIVPRCNRDATDVADVYDINDIVPKNILKTLYEVKLEEIESNAEGKSKFFKQTLEILKNLSNPNKRLATLLYIEAVSTWLNIPIKDAKKRGSEICPLSTQINDYVIEKYSSPSANGRLRPNSLKDTGIVHCMILALAICNYSLDLELFATEIGGRIGLKKLTEFASMICAVPLKDKKTVVLKLPLPPQVSGRRFRRQRK